MYWNILDKTLEKFEIIIYIYIYSNNEENIWMIIKLENL